MAGHALTPRLNIVTFGVSVVACGAALVKSAEKVFWGGYSCSFADPDGHLWEVAHNPFVTIDSDEHLKLP